MNRYIRLEAIANAVSQVHTAADIGTDHGFVPIWLVKNGKAVHAIASDIGKGPLARAQEHILKEGLTDRIETRLGSGLSTLAVGEADCIIIAGMGGLLTVDILKEGLEVAKSAKELILSPHTDADAVRRFLTKEVFSVTDEQMVREDGKYYVIMKVFPKPEERALSEDELRFGPVLLREKPDIFLQYLKNERRKKKALTDKLERFSENDGIRAALAEKKADLAQIERILAQWKKQT